MAGSIAAARCPSHVEAPSALRWTDAPDPLGDQRFSSSPRGNQSYLHTFAGHLPPDKLVVYAPRWRGDSHKKFDAAQPFEVVRHPTTLMLPSPFVARRAAKLVKKHDCESVWFGAAAPLALLAPVVRRAGASRVIASTHGHEVGWSMIPGARQSLRVIGDHTDAVTFVRKYTRGRFSAAFGPQAALEHLPSGVDTSVFHPDSVARAELRKRYGLGERPTILCLSRLVPRKGQDMLIKALPTVRKSIDGAVLVIVGGGPYEDHLRQLARKTGMDDHVVFTGTVPAAELAAHHTIADVFAMPCRNPRRRIGRRRTGNRLPRGLGYRCAGHRRAQWWRSGNGAAEQDRARGRRHLGSRRRRIRDRGAVRS